MKAKNGCNTRGRMMNKRGEKRRVEMVKNWVERIGSDSKGGESTERIEWEIFQYQRDLD